MQNIERTAKQIKDSLKALNTDFFSEGATTSVDSGMEYYMELLTRFGINMLEGIELPLACAATCISSINVQRMSVKAAMTGDVDLLKLAVLHDPLVGAICTPDEVWQMVDEMLVAQAEWLPQYAHAIPQAKERMRNPKVKTREWAGAARQHVRSVEEMRVAKPTSIKNVGHSLGTKVMG